MIEPGEEAMLVWREACQEENETFYRVGEQPDDPEGAKQSAIAQQAAAAVIEAALANAREGERNLVVQWIEGYADSTAEFHSVVPGFIRDVAARIADGEYKTGLAVNADQTQAPANPPQ